MLLFLLIDVLIIFAIVILFALFKGTGKVASYGVKKTKEAWRPNVFQNNVPIVYDKEGLIINWAEADQDIEPELCSSRSDGYTLMSEQDLHDSGYMDNYSNEELEEIKKWAQSR